jgi:chemotaxis regulatin CheY-phosphate phosphatase CheZ
MARRNELELASRIGNLARSLFAALLLVLVVPCFARPPQPQAARPRFENNQQPHLGAWLQRHGNLPLDQQEKALQSEPGFNRLTPETQQKLLDRLRQINHMPPNQRQRTVDRIEAMEHLTPQMRQQVRASVQQFHALPADRQRLVKKAFRDLREYPPEQRATMMNSSQFQAQFTPQERTILGNILTVEPYQPVHGSGLENGLQYGH